MPWCPKCKMEYREGITECVDCNIPLVEELEKEIELEVLAMTEEEALATKLVEFLKYSKIESATTSFDEADNTYSILVEKTSLKSAKKLYQAFCIAELEREVKEKAKNLANESNEDSGQQNTLDEEIETKETGEDSLINHDKEALTEEASADSLQEQTERLRGAKAITYVKKEDKYNDLKSTAYMFITFGVLGLIVVVLNAVGVLTLFSGIIPITVMSILFLGFLYIGFNSLKKANTAKEEIGEELDLTKQVQEWLEQNMTATLLSQLHDDTLTEEVNYIHKMERVKEMLIKDLGEIDDAFLDQTIEEFYDEHFED